MLCIMDVIYCWITLLAKGDVASATLHLCSYKDRLVFTGPSSDWFCFIWRALLRVCEQHQ